MDVGLDPNGDAMLHRLRVRAATHSVPDTQRRRAMQVLLFAISDEAAFNAMTEDEQQRAYAAFGEYGKALREASVLLGNYRPQPMAKAKTVRITDGKTEVREGLYVQTREPITGVYVIDVPDADAAILWAERNPVAAFGVVEVRPV
jgi:hypothetical protein